MDTKVCSTCKIERDVQLFKSKIGRELKQCQHCRDNKRPIKCPHNKQYRFCKECGGSSICPHDKRKVDCFECKGSGMCVHGVHKYWCLKCDPVKA